MCHSNDYQHLDPTTQGASVGTRGPVRDRQARFDSAAPVAGAAAAAPALPSKPTRIVVSGQPLAHDEMHPWPPAPYDWEMAATAGDAILITNAFDKPSRLERLRRAFRMQP